MRSGPGSAGSPSPAAVPGGLYRCGEVSTYVLGDEMELVHCRDTGAAHIVPAYLADVLRRCVTFASLEQLAHDRCRDLGLDRDGAPSLLRDLVTLVERGLLVPPPDLRAPATPPRRIATVGLVTRDRASTLRGALESYIANGTAQGRASDFVVIDDSASDESCTVTRQMLRSLRARYGVAIAHAGGAEKRAFATVLASRHRVPRDVVDFALFGLPECGLVSGANRNALLLHTIGDLVFGAADDTVGHAAPAPSVVPGLVLAGPADPTELVFFASQEVALGALSFVDVDILGLHEQMLGRDVPGLLGESAADPRAVDRASPALLGRLARGRGRVVITASGVVGTAGTGTALSYLFATGASRESLVESEGVYRAALDGGPVVRSVRQSTITEASLPSSSMCMGLDNRELLPPFFPVQRGADAVFSHCIRACLDEGCSGWLPWVLRHAPVGQRVSPADAMVRDARRVGTSRLVAACLPTVPAVGQTTAEGGLRALGRHLTQLGAMPLEDFEEHLRMALWRHTGARIAHLEDSLRVAGGAPGYWARDVERVIEALREPILDANYGIPHDLGAGRDPQTARRLTQRLVGEFGRLLDVWPDLVEEARRLRGEGCRLAQPV